MPVELSAVAPATDATDTATEEVEGGLTEGTESEGTESLPLPDDGTEEKPAPAEGEEQEDAEEAEAETPPDADADTEAAAKSAEVLDIQEPEYAARVEKAKQQYRAEEEQIKTRIDSKIIPRAQELQRQQTQLQARIAAIENGAKDADFPSGYRALTPQEVREINAIDNRLAQIPQEAQALLNEKNQAQFQADNDLYFRTNLNAHPVLKPYETEMRQLIGEGFKPNNVPAMLAACKAYREISGGKPAPKMSTAEIKQRALTDSLNKKAKAKIGAGSGGSGNAPRAAVTKIPAEVQSRLDYYRSTPTKK